MKNLYKSTALLICFSFLLSSTSCLVVTHREPGKHGWRKNSNNPHHPNSTNPGHGNKKGKHK